ncbi:MAG: Naringenin-chalcone synthase [uncultured Acidimicrobiales bacterium]|uniref:Naringenin-chalcone synthase n=1 Tax=uncultured Acidimicrobiales bacterium TaxID=310071 RepID=A0A6J4H8W4_9ACTN|nr:MAG: Naringenin-chalcone synthase [uncultured Acidimicrobiales bacterium]
MVSAAISAFGTAFPPPLDQRAAWDEFFAEHYAGSRIAARLWTNSGVRTRHAAVDPRSESLALASTGARMRRFVDEAIPLGKSAVDASLAAAGLTPADVDAFTVVSCTGYATPGIDILLARDLGMPESVQRLNVGHMGCYAALPALATVADAAVARGQVGVMLCVELTSLHLQPPTDDLEQVVAHSLFSDGAAAIVVTPDAPGLELVDFVACTDAATAEEMRWDVTDLGFRMTLSPQVPVVLEANAARVTSGLLARQGLTIADVDHWAVHPGGPKIITSIAKALDLDEDAVTVSRDVLRDHGNCSSATILVVLDELVRQRTPTRGQHIVAMAFGPGLTLYMALLRVR